MSKKSVFCYNFRNSAANASGLVGVFQPIRLPHPSAFSLEFLKFRDASLARVLIAYLISAVLGWLSAVLFYRGRRALIVLPLFDVLQSFPAFSALPLAVIFWGRSNFTIIVFLVIAIIWPIFFSIISSLKLIRRDWEEAVEMSGLSGIRYLTHFLIPVSAPGLVTGSIIGLGEGWEALVATEIIVSPHRGLGEFFGAFAHDPVITGFGVLGVLLLIFSINKLIWLPLLERGHRMMEE
ncbi:MAG: ABC transporter permease subunit [Candidatus Sungbacteria bacterium]|uniref:ABC transporter permease subunit n=1 Tax=Candidatus Sungiibacteriota bacterium TaxID=2750080 RepID=A0A932QYR3_9BACT|nr:ABC transporter permease subunit [Candidatus Sungbacteria bacterium]